MSTPQYPTTKASGLGSYRDLASTGCACCRSVSDLVDRNNLSVAHKSMIMCGLGKNLNDICEEEQIFPICRPPSARTASTSMARTRSTYVRFCYERGMSPIHQLHQ
ncbi:hypothetical protein PybrP1_011613 [[Pythium] brassicae (nom. inval.)]|nr:hypothetical protein PybrP1_011613 [[Pythium] brassicae (nom. inval.)]